MAWRTLSTVGSAVAAFVVAVGITCWLHWPQPLALDRYQSLSAFHDGHVWCFDYIARMVTGEVSWDHTTREIGHPERVELRFITWLPAVLAMPLRPLLGPLGAYTAIVLASPGLVALAAWWLVRRLTHAGPWAAAGASLPFALCPYMLGAMASGQTAKMQLWIVPLYLLALMGLLRGGRGWRWRAGAAVALALVTVVASFTSPTTTLQIPLVAGAWIVGEVLRGGKRFWAVGLVGVLALGITASSLLPARSYFASLRGSRLVQAFEPGVPPSPGVIPSPAPMAMPEQILDGEIDFDNNPRITSHVTYLGWPLLGVCLLLTVRRFEGRWFAWGGVALGVVIALGPKLAADGAYVTNDDGYTYALPARILELTHYPMSESGMYYRAISLSSLGLAVLIGGACGSFRRPWGALLAWILGLGAVADAHRVVSPIYPRPSRELPGLALYEKMAADPVPGGVISLPLETDVQGGEVHIQAVAFHRRSTQALPRQNRAAQLPFLGQLQGTLRAALQLDDPPAGRAALADAGYRYVIWHDEAQNDSWPLSTFERGLGPPEELGGVRYWVLETSK